MEGTIAGGERGRLRTTSRAPLILVFDVGMTNVKAVLFSENGTLVDRASVPYPTQRPRVDRVEQNPEDWWTATVQAANELWRRRPDAPRDLAVIAVTGHMHAVVCVGADGGSIGPSLVLGDRRGLNQARRITAELGASLVYAVTGAEIDASIPTAKIAWLCESDPRRFQATRYFLACKDWVRFRLTGVLATDPIDACATGLFDISRGAWSPELMAAAGIDESRLPVVRPPEDSAGTVGPQAATAIGVPAGLPVAVGGGDDIEVLGNGLLAAGESLEHLGTTGSILTVSDRLVYDPERRLEVYPHAIPGLWVLGGSMTTAGAAISHARDLLGMDPAAAVGSLCAARDLEPRGPVFLPNLVGERCPTRTPGATGAWCSITLGASREALMAAAYRGVAFALKRILDRIEAVAGPQRRITVSGGYDVDPEWLRLRTDTYRRPLSILATAEPTALGGMAIAATSVGLYRDLTTAVQKTTATTETILPDPENAHALQDEYARYIRFSDALVTAWQDASDSEPL